VGPVELSLSAWRAREAAHEARVDAATAGHRERAARGEPHPVEDFLFRYYRCPPRRLRRWHPGAGVVLRGAAGMPRASSRWYGMPRRGPADAVAVDVDAFLADRGAALDRVRALVGATLGRPAAFRCFGLHEWAMVHRLGQSGVRHPAWPLRLGAVATDEVVESGRLRCTHHDAYRFFTPSAAPRNATAPTRATQVDDEQPGCLHAGMDLYRWCYELAPLVPSELTADAFDLAREIRVLDMRASPYDLRALGLEPVAVETAAGRTAYVDAQRAFAERSQTLRRRLLGALEPARRHTGGVVVVGPAAAPSPTEGSS
jgi:hypothetical protein